MIQNDLHKNPLLDFKIGHKYDEQLMEKSPKIINQSSILSFASNAILESFLEILCFDLE